MRWRALFIAGLVCHPAQAEQLASDYFAHCVGPGFERQSRAHYALLGCQAEGTCPAYDPVMFASKIETSCYETALNICMIYNDADGCISRLTELLNDITNTLRAEFSDQRVRAAAENGNGFLANSLARALDERGEVSGYCFDPGLLRIAKAFDVSEEVACAGFEAIVSRTQESMIARRTLQLEAEAK